MVKAKADFDAAQARLEAAQARGQSLLFQIMALLKLSPAEYKSVIDEKGLRFKKIVLPSSVQAKQKE